MLTHTIPLPAGGAGWLAAGFSEEALLDFAGFVVAAGLEDAGADELAGAAAVPELLLDADELAGWDDAVDFAFLEEDLVEADSEAAGVDAGADALELLASAEAFVDFDFLVLADFVPESEAVESALASVEEALVDLDFFELDDFELASAESVESAFADLDFFELVDFVSAEAASLEDLVDFFVLAALVSLSDAAVLVFFDFDADESEADLSVASVELASVAFFFLVVFLVELALESLVSVLCALVGAKLASPRLSPAETRNANTYFFSAVIPIPPQFCAVV